MRFSWSNFAPWSGSFLRRPKPSTTFPQRTLRVASSLSGTRSRNSAHTAPRAISPWPWSVTAKRTSHVGAHVHRRAERLAADRCDEIRLHLLFGDDQPRR